MRETLTIPRKHILHKLVSSERVARPAPVVGSHLDDGHRDRDPEEHVEALEGAAGRELVLPVERRELLGEHHVPELRLLSASKKSPFLSLLLY